MQRNSVQLLVAAGFFGLAGSDVMQHATKFGRKAVALKLSLAPSPMAPHDAAWYVGLGIGLVLGSLVTGALIGLLPLLLGRKFGQGKLGLIGFVVCVLCSLVGGLLLSVPAAVVFSATVWWRSRSQPRRAESPPPRDGA